MIYYVLLKNIPLILILIIKKVVQKLAIPAGIPVVKGLKKFHWFFVFNFLPEKKIAGFVQRPKDDQFKKNTNFEAYFRLKPKKIKKAYFNSNS